MRCLLVEPSSMMARMIEHVLRDAGFDDTVVLTDAEAAFEYLEAAEGDERPRLFVTELDLRHEDGLDLIRRIRGEEWGAALPVLVVTSRNARDDVEAAVEAGVQGYVLKPFAPDTLARRLSRFAAAAEAPATEGASGEDRTDTTADAPEGSPVSGNDDEALPEAA